MDLLPDLNDLNIVPVDAINEEGQINIDIEEDESTEQHRIETHDDIFITNKITKIEEPKKSKREHLEEIRPKSIVARHGTKEHRAEKKRLKEEEKERKKEARAAKRELKKEENKRKARERYWDNKAKKELEKQKQIEKTPLLIPEPQRQPQPRQRSQPRYIEPEPQPIMPNGLSYNQFATYMDTYRQNKPKKEPKIVYKEVIKEVIKEVERQPIAPKYPSLFNHIDF